MPNTVNSYMVTDLGNVSPNPRGEYNATYDYEYLDLVYYKGGSYVCLAPLGETIANVAPIAGQTTTNWQCVAIPGDITPEYISMYNEVVKDYNETNTNTADVAQMKDVTYASMTAAQESESKASTSETNARNSEVNAKQSMDKAKEYSDEAIRVNNDTQSLVTGFDEHVATAISNAKASISESTDNAKGEIVAQKSSSLNEFRTDAETVMTNEKNVAVAEIHQMVDDFSADADSKKQEVIQVADEKINAMTALKDDTINAKNAAETASTTAFEKANEATTSADNAKASSDEAKANAELVAADKAIVAADKTEIGGMKSAVESSVAKFESDLETYNLPTMNNDINALKSDLDDLKAIEYSDLELAIIEDGNLNFSNVGSLNSDGTIKSQDTGYSTSDYISTTKLYGVFRYGTGDTRFNKLQYAEYDENKNLIGSVHEVTTDYDFETYDGKIGVFYKTTYPNTAYIRIVSKPSWGQSHLLLRNKNIYTVDGELKDYIPKNSIRTNSENDVRYFPLIGKKIVCFGDSITEGIGSTNITYPEVIADYTKAIVYNVGIGGQTYIKVVNEDHDAFVAPMLVKAIIDNDWSNIDAHINYLSDRAKEHIALLKTIDFNDIDIVTFAYGTNDWNMIVNSNAYDMSTHWYDSNQYRYIEYAFKETIEPLLTAYPHLKIYVFTPCFRSRQELNDGKDSDNYPKVYSQDSSEKYLYEYCDFLESLAEKYHVPCKNVYRDGNLSLVNSNYYLVDGVHRNDLGYKLLGEQYAKFILSN